MLYRAVVVLVGNSQLRGVTDEPSCNAHVSGFDENQQLFAFSTGTRPLLGITLDEKKGLIVVADWRVYKARPRHDVCALP